MQKHGKKIRLSVIIHPDRAKYLQEKLAKLKAENPEQKWNEGRVVDLALSFMKLYDEQKESGGPDS